MSGRTGRAVGEADQNHRVGGHDVAVAPGVRDVETAGHDVHGDPAVGQFGGDRLDVDPIRLLHSDVDVDDHVVVCLAGRSEEVQAAVVDRVEHGPAGGLGVIVAAYVDAHAHLGDPAG